MIIKQKDIMKEIYEEYPDLTKGCLDKICKKGLSGVNMTMRRGFELFIKLIVNKKEDEMKFFIPTSPEIQSEISSINAYKLAQKQKRNEEANS